MNKFSSRRSQHIPSRTLSRALRDNVLSGTPKPFPWKWSLPFTEQNTLLQRRKLMPKVDQKDVSACWDFRSSTWALLASVF